MRPDEAFGTFPVPRMWEHTSFQAWGKKGAENDPAAWTAIQEWFVHFMEARADHARWRKVGAKHGLVLVGPPGTGKSALASSLLNEIAQKGYCAYLLDGDITPLLRQRQKGYIDDDDEAMLDMLTRITCVVWDDLMRLGGDESLAEYFFRARFRNGVPTIITLNNDVRLGTMMSSFLSPFTWIPFTGADLRKVDAGR